MFCQNCGAEINDKAVVCVKCGCAVNGVKINQEVESKEWLIVLLLCFFLGCFGVHRFYVGKTGTGKTTILSLICRNYDIQKGQILIDGIDIKKIKISSLRKHFGQMLQDVFLFSGDIRSNIVLREEKFSDEEVMEACRYVNADSFINKLEAGLDEVVQERGNNFSAGQRQLLSFARTLAYDPKILVLDEVLAVELSPLYETYKS